MIPVLVVTLLVLSGLTALEIAHSRHAIGARLWMLAGFIFGPVGVLAAFLAPERK